MPHDKNHSILALIQITIRIQKFSNGSFALREETIQRIYEIPKLFAVSAYF